MNHGKNAGILSASLVAVLLAGCSGGGSSGANSISSAVQNLSLDPSGRTTVVTFGSASGLSGANTSSFTAENGCTPLSVSVSGNVATIEWSDRVTPSTRVRATGLPSVSGDYAQVTTSDSSAPQWSIEWATQVPGLGNDQIDVHFSGPWVVESEVETAAHWSVLVGGTTMDLAGSTFDFSPLTQRLTITLGDLANLHSSFELRSSGLHSVADVSVATTSRAGSASGDAVAPTVVSVQQNLAEDEYGRVVDFVFSEAMDPVFNAAGDFDTGSLQKLATSVEQLAGSPDTLRVTFSAPVVPGRDEVSLSGIVDCAGNSCADGARAVTQPSPVANDYSADPAVLTVPGPANDVVLVSTSQALDPQSAVEAASWSIEIGGSAYDLSNCVFEYDLLSKTLSITLDSDVLNGTSVVVTGVAVLDVDGQLFGATRGGSAAGDATAPSIVGATQDRGSDAAGTTVDATFDETVDPAQAGVAGNWSASGTQTCQSATVQPNGTTVRLVFDEPVVPGVHTLACLNVADLAGNTMNAVAGYPVTSNDATAPTVVSVAAEAVAGAQNDTLAVVFDDGMWADDVTDASYWTVESPVGTNVPLTGATIAWDAAARTATITWSNAFNYTGGDDCSVSCAGMRDLGGNACGATTTTCIVSGETTLPYVVAAVRDGSTPTRLGVRFSEHCRGLADAYNPVSNPAGTARFVLHPAGGGTVWPTASTSVDGGLGCDLDFAVPMGAGDTLDVLWVADCAGNTMYPEFGVATQAADSNEPSFAVGLTSFYTVSGELNDYAVVEFDRPMSPWGMTDSANWTITGPDGAVDLSNAVFEFDGVSTTTIRMRSGANTDFATGGGYTVTYANGRSSHGVAMTAAASEGGIVAAGDSTAPGVAVNGARIDAGDPTAVYVTVSEAVDATGALVPANWDLDGSAPVSVEVQGQRSMRLVFAGTVTVGGTLGYTLRDLAGNTGSSTTAVAAADTTAPSMTLTATSTSGRGGDQLDIAWSEPLLLSTALVPANYTVTAGGLPVSTTGATFSYRSTGNVVCIRFADGVNFPNGAAVSVTVSGVRDCAGNQVAAGSNGACTASGDATAPTIVGAYVNLQADPAGMAIDVLCSEDVLATQALSAANWSVMVGGSPSVANTVGMVEQVQSGNWRLWRVWTSQPVGASHSVRATTLQDYAGNTGSGATVDPTEPN